MIKKRLWVTTRSINEWITFYDGSLAIQIHDINASNVILRMEMDAGTIPTITPNVPLELLCIPSNIFRDGR